MFPRAHVLIACSPAGSSLLGEALETLGDGTQLVEETLHGGPLKVTPTLGSCPILYFLVCCNVNSLQDTLPLP